MKRIYTGVCGPAVFSTFLFILFVSLSLARSRSRPLALLSWTLFILYYCRRRRAYETKLNHSTLFWYRRRCLLDPFKANGSTQSRIPCSLRRTWNDVDNNNELSATTWNQFSYFSSYALFIFSTRINPMSATKERYFFALYSGNKFLIAFCFPGLLYFITKFFFPSVDVDKWNEILSP